MNSSPLSNVRNGLCRCTLGTHGMPPRSTSSMLGWVAAVIAIVSPSQPRPAVIQRMWILVMGIADESASWAYSGELGMRFLSGIRTCPAVCYDACEGLPAGSASARLYRIERNVSGFLVWRGGMPHFGSVQLEYRFYWGSIRVRRYCQMHWALFCLVWLARNREVNRVDNSDSLRDGAYHSVWLDQNVARSYPLHENTCHVAHCSSTSPDRGWLNPSCRSVRIRFANLQRSFSHVVVV